MSGGIVAAMALVAAVHAPTYGTFLLLYGVIGGFGLGLIYMPSIIAVGYYFERKRAIATGLAVSGSGVGTIIVPVLAHVAIEGKILGR